MRISLQVDADPGLTTLQNIEVERLALISGYNGIGKSTAIRLLELCVGGQPWRFHPSAWRSLCLGLKSGRVAVADLDASSSITWNLRPDQWARSHSQSGPPHPDDSWFEIEIDGLPARLSDVAGLLEVRHIAGDMTLVQTIALEISHLAERFGRLTREARGPTALAAVELLTQAAEQFRAADAATVEARRKVRDATAANARMIQSRIIEVGERLTALENASEIAVRLERVLGAFPDLERQLGEISARLDDAVARHQALQDELRSAEVAAARADTSKREVANARRLAEQHRASLRKVNSELTELLSSLGVDAESADLGERIHAGLEAVSADLDELRRRRHEIDSSPLLDSTLGDLLAALSRARARGIGGEVVVVDFGQESLSVDDLYGLLSARRADLAARPTEGTAELDQAIRRVEGARAQLSQALKLFKDRQRIPPLIERAERRVEHALEDLPDPARFRKLSEAVAEAEALVSVLAEQRAVLAGRQLALADGATPEDLTSKLDRAFSNLGVSSRDQLEGLRVECSRELSLMRGSHETAQREAQRAADALEVAQLENQMALEAIADNVLYQRIASASRQSAPAQVSLRTELASALLQDLPNRLDAIQGILIASAEHVAGRERQPDNEVATRVTRWLTETVSGWFRDPSVKAALFPSAVTVGVNLSRRQVEWADASGKYELPFEAFSSGQQAFAYTKARLEELGKAKAPNRVIALDEFGAFLAHDLMDDLRGMLVERADRHPKDRVLLILPLTDDPGALAKVTTGRDRERHLERQGQLDSHGYYMEEIR